MAIAEHREEAPALDLSAIDSEALYEVIDGQVVEKATVGAYECWLANALYDLLSPHLTATGQGRAYVEMLFDLGPAVNRHRRPDAAVVSAERWPIDRPAPRAEAWPVVPDLAVEIISPSNTALAMVEKVAEYFRAGVRRVWVIYPRPEQVHDYRTPTTVTILTRADRLDGGDVLPGFAVDLGAYFGAPEEPA